jgi:hypothetical protein
LPTDIYVYAFAVSGTNLFCGTQGGVFRWTNNGASWAEGNTGLTNILASALAVSNANLFAGTYGGGVFRSADNDTSWTPASTGLTNTFVTALVISDTNLFAGTNSGVFLSTNDGDNWSQINSGLPASMHVRSLVAFSTNLFAGTYGRGVWRRPLAEMITSVETSPGGTPTAFELSQNYPNPFNPGTTIKYELPASSMVRLSVYDMLGREVSVLVNERRDAGVHEVRFDGSNLASGVYFYRLQAGDFVQSKSLLILK